MPSSGHLWHHLTIFPEAGTHEHLEIFHHIFNLSFQKTRMLSPTVKSLQKHLPLSTVTWYVLLTLLRTVVDELHEITFSITWHLMNHRETSMHHLIHLSPRFVPPPQESGSRLSGRWVTPVFLHQGTKGGWSRGSLLTMPFCRSNCFSLVLDSLCRQPSERRG